jgi:hypothetical protein
MLDAGVPVGELLDRRRVSCRDAGVGGIEAARVRL